MHLEGLELAFGTLDESCFAINEVEDVHAAARVVLYGTAEGMAARLDEFVGMQSGPLFLDAFFVAQHFEVVGYLRLDEWRGALPLDDELAALHVDGPWLAVQAEACPVPQLEGEDAGRRADFEHHAVVTGTMDGAGRDEVVVVFLGWQFVDVLLGVEQNLAPLSSPQVLYHLHLVDAFFQAEIDHRVLASIKQIVALVLRVGQTELLLCELVGGMYLEAEVAALHGVEEVEADGETLAEAMPHLLSEQLASVSQHDILRRQLEELTVGLQVEAVLLGHAVEAPAVVHLFARQVADFLHPLASPRSRVEERNDAEGFPSRAFQALPHLRVGNHFRLVATVRVNPELDASALHQLVLVAVDDVPVVEVTSFILHRGTVLVVVDAERLHFVSAEALLNLPASHVGVNY